MLHIYPLLPISLMYQTFNLQFTSSLSSLASVLPLMLPLFGIHFLKTFVHHPLLPFLERSSKPISTQRHILLSPFFSYGFSVVLTYFCPWTLNLHIAIVLLRLRVHYSVEIKHYKRIRIRIRLYPLDKVIHSIAVLIVNKLNTLFHVARCSTLKILEIQNVPESTTDWKVLERKKDISKENRGFLTIYKSINRSFQFCTREVSTSWTNSVNYRQN